MKKKLHLASVSHQDTYQVPLRFRRGENLHILFWLLKDLGWALEMKTFGIIMIFPTIFLAILITYRNRRNTAELFHNTAIVFWLIANTYWMISEFAGFDNTILFSFITYKKLCIIPFIIGLSLLIYFYAFKNKRITSHEEN